MPISRAAYRTSEKLENMAGIIAKTLSEQIYTVIRNQIVSGDLPTDVAIRQDAMAKELGVSKIPLREAFARLERDGLLISITNRGFFVPPLKTSEVEEVYALRLKLEPEAAARACKFATAEDRKHAMQILHEQENCPAEDKVRMVEYNQHFHMLLVRPLQLPITMQFLERISAVAGRYVCKHLEVYGRKARAKSEHLALLEAWSAGRAKTVESLLYDHIATTLENLRTQLKLAEAPTEGKDPRAAR